ncbi:hypothetical protein CHARACLAT_011569 [Characodon lateralis]|uniref:Uncharacterized protein n=1 Tax=Characodon lateralis TaxID=208331 RepID=A0ABU7ELG1_9TELE|nr:hypothetical protein [Characodon lateralis]
MDLVNWSLNAIDQNFSTEGQGKGEPSCPDGTFFSGYTMNSWQKWRIVCLTMMSVKDVEDVYIIGFLITGFLLFGVGYLAYREIGKTSAAVLAFARLPGLCEGICRAINTQTEMLRDQNRKLDVILQDRRLAAVPGLSSDLAKDQEFCCLDSPLRSTSETLKADGKLRVCLTNNCCFSESGSPARP